MVFGGDLLAGIQIRMYSFTLEWVVDNIDVCVRNSYFEFWIFPEESGVFGYIVREWVCCVYFTVFDGTFKYYEFRCVADAGAESGGIRDASMARRTFSTMARKSPHGL